MRCPSVCPSRSWILSKRVTISSNFFSPSGTQTILVFPYQTSRKYSDGDLPNRGVECRWGRHKSRLPANISLSIDDCWSLLSADGRPSSGVSQSLCVSVYGAESHASVNTPKRREHNLIYAAANLKREYN